MVESDTFMADHLSGHSRPLHNADVSRVVVAAERIQRRVDEIAADILRRYDGGELVVLAVMTGSLVFLADLIRRLPMPMRLSLVCASSYPGASTSSNGIKSVGEIAASLYGRDVLVVDDIIDTGRTLRALVEQVRRHSPRSVRTCVLLRKRLPRDDQPSADFLGFEIDDEFVVGYGLDYDDLFRNLPDLRVLELPAGGPAA